MGGEYWLAEGLLLGVVRELRQLRSDTRGPATPSATPVHARYESDMALQLASFSHRGRERIVAPADLAWANEAYERSLPVEMKLKGFLVGYAYESPEVVRMLVADIAPGLASLLEFLDTRGAEVPERLAPAVRSWTGALTAASSALLEALRGDWACGSSSAEAARLAAKATRRIRMATSSLTTSTTRTHRGPDPVARAAALSQRLAYGRVTVITSTAPSVADGDGK